MTKKQKKTLKRIIAAAVLTVLLALLFHFVELPWFVQLVLWLVPYLVTVSYNHLTLPANREGEILGVGAAL